MNQSESQKTECPFCCYASIVDIEKIYYGKFIKVECPQCKKYFNIFVPDYTERDKIIEKLRSSIINFIQNNKEGEIFDNIESIRKAGYNLCIDVIISASKNDFTQDDVEENCTPSNQEFSSTPTEEDIRLTKSMGINLNF